MSTDLMDHPIAPIQQQETRSPEFHQKILEELISSSPLFQTLEPSEVPIEIAEIPFGNALWQWLEVASLRLEALTTPEMRQQISAEAFLALKKSLVERWSKCCTPSWTLEMGIARMQGVLKGKTSEERYESFVQQNIFSPDSLRAFFQEYPLVGKFVATFLDQWVHYTSDFLKHLQTDSLLLKQHFQPQKDLGIVTFIETELGDPHCNGKSVCCLTFESGLSLFYKPKNLKIVATFNSFIEELNQLGLLPSLKTYGVLNRHNHCWEEHVQHLPCQSAQEVVNFFQRAGMLLCCAYLFQSFDVHSENLIASGEHPFLIDLETLFCSQLKNSDYETAASNQLLYSVLSTIMLPQYAFGEPGRPGIDVSALTADNEKQNPRPAQMWKNLNTDEMYLAYETQPPKAIKNKHRAILNEKLTFALDHVDELVQGFENMYDFIQKHLPQLLEQKAALWQMSHSPVRIVLRQTTLYMRLLHSLFDPTVCLDANQIEQILDPLSRFPIHQDKEVCALIVAEEKSALLQGDVPCFHTRPTEQHLYIEERLVVKNVLKEVPYDCVKNRLEKMNSKECDLQTTFIRQAFKAYQASEYGDKQTLSKSPPLTSTENASLLSPLDKKGLLSLIETLACDLRNNAFQDKNGALGWIALDALPSVQQFALRPLTDNFYSGATGIALFFAALSAVSGNSQWKEETLNTLLPLKNFLKLNSNGKNRLIAAHGIGGMIGMGGIIYGVFHTGKLISDPKLIAFALELVSGFEERHIEEDLLLDIIGGSAGLLLTMLSLYQNSGSEGALNVAKLCGKHLCNKALDLGEGQFAWKCIKAPPLTGFSHGAAGIAYALIKLAYFTQESRFLEYALGGMRYERAHFSLEKGNWSDLRQTPPDFISQQWCHGACGIGLGRLASLPYYSESAMHAEIESAIKTSENTLITPVNHLCCGTFGRLAFLHDASKISNSHHEHLTPIIWNALTVLASENASEPGHAKPTIKTDDNGYYNPTFMRGAAGIGYTLLRILDAKNLPQPLIFE